MPDNSEIEKFRTARNIVNQDIPFHFLHEEEPDLEGNIQSINTIFLTSKEVLLMIFKPLPMSKKAKSIDNQLLLYFHTLFRQRLSAPFTMLRMRYGGGVQPMLFGTQTKS